MIYNIQDIYRITMGQSQYICQHNMCSLLRTPRRFVKVIQQRWPEQHHDRAIPLARTPRTRVMITEVILESLTGNLISQKQSCRDEMCRQKLKDWIKSYHISHLRNSPCSILAWWIKGESTSFAPGMTNPLTPVCTVQLMVETPAPAKSLWSCIYHNGF